MDALVIVLLSLIIVSIFIILIGHGIRAHALNNQYTNPTNLVSCDKYKLKHFNANKKQLMMSYVTILTGYGILFLFLLIATIKAMFIIPKDNVIGGITKHNKSNSKLLSIVSTLIVLATISYKIWVYVRYNKTILDNKLADEFYLFSNISTFLILCFVFCYMNSIIAKTSLSNINPVICVLGILGIIVIAMSHISILFFSTDG